MNWKELLIFLINLINLKKIRGWGCLNKTKQKKRTKTSFCVSPLLNYDVQDMHKIFILSYYNNKLCRTLNLFLGKNVHS